MGSLVEGPKNGSLQIYRNGTKMMVILKAFSVVNKPRVLQLSSACGEQPTGLHMTRATVNIPGKPKDIDPI